MQKLQLNNESFAEAGNRTKFMTIRKGRRDIQLGPLELESVGKVTDGDHLRMVVDVHRVSYTTVGSMCDREAKEDGFKSVQDLIDKMQLFYPGLDSDTVITLVYWS